MTQTGRLIVAVVALVAATAIGMYEREYTLVSTTLALILGYTFGEKNSERRQAQADILARGGVAKDAVVRDVLAVIEGTKPAP